MSGTPANSSDEDEQRAKAVQQQAKNEQLFVIVRKKCPQEQIIDEIQLCLHDGAEINTVNTRGKTILDIAQQKKYNDLVTFLSERGGKATFDLGDNNYDSSFVKQKSGLRINTNFPQEIHRPSSKHMEGIKTFLLADGNRYLTKDKLNKINSFLQSCFETQKIIDLIMECGIDMSCKDFRTNTYSMAIDIAWEYGFYDSMLMLLEAGSKFPTTFTLEALDNDIPEKLKQFILNRQQLHHWIKNNRLEEIKNYILSHQLSSYFSIENKSVLEIAAEYANNTEIIACLSSALSPLKDPNISKRQSRLLLQVNTEGNTLLSIAAKSGNSENVEYFIGCGIDVNHRNKFSKHAIDLAWANNHYKVVLLLLKADSDYPSYFHLGRLNEETDQKILKQFVKRRNSLHELIEKNRLEDIKTFTSVDKSKLYLNSHGQSALFTAIKKKKFDIYAYLKSIGLTLKNEEEEEYIYYLPIDERDALKIAMIQEFPQVDRGHIYYLISKSRSQKPIDNFKERTEKLFMYLDSIPEISIILQVVQYTDYLDIVFDFDNDNIMDINPTASEATRGTTDYKDGRIYVAANTDEKQLFGTLAHELTHLAMYILYKNDCNPFDTGENEQGRAFKNITAEIQRRLYNVIEHINGTENNPIATLVTAFKYPRNEQQSELIARVPHILAQYPRIAKHLLNSQFRTLLAYYNDQKNGGLLQRCKEFIKNGFLIKPRNSMQFLNETLGEVNNVIKYGIHFKKPMNLNNFLNSEKQVFLLQTKSMFLSILNVYESLVIHNKHYSIQDTLFFELNSYIEKQDEVIKLFYSPIGKILCLGCSSESNKETLSQVLKTLKVLLSIKSDKKIIIIIEEREHYAYDTVTNMFKDNCKHTIDHEITFNHLTSDSQQIVLERHITFLGESIKLNEVIDLRDNVAKQVIDVNTLVKLIKGQRIEIGRRLPDTSYLEGAYCDILEEVDMETFIDKLVSPDPKETFVISGITGLNKHACLLKYLNSHIEELIKQSKFSNVNLLKQLINKFQEKQFSQNIVVTDESFDEEEFSNLCHKNPAEKIYWIHLKKCVKESKFILQKMYNPDFYIPGKRFNQEVVIEKDIKEELCSATLSDIYVIQVKQEKEIKKWFQFNSEQNLLFETNRKSHKIMFVTSLYSWKDYFQSHSPAFANQIVHLLKFRKDQLIWCKTYGSIKNILQYNTKEYKNAESFMNDNDTIERIINEKVTILAGDPGTGKSTSLNQLCNTKRTLQSDKIDSIIKLHWVIKINLKHNIQASKKFNLLHCGIHEKNNLSRILDFLLQSDKQFLNNSTEKFAKGLLELVLTNNSKKPFLIMFDGFDEILDKTNRSMVISLMQYLKDKTNAKLCITTRLHYEKDLEAALSTFAVRLEPMDNVTVLTLIVQYFRSRFGLLLSPDISDEIPKFADAFLLRMQEIFNGDVSKFVSIPLQLYLMLEVSSGYCPKTIQGKRYLKSLDFSYLGDDIWDIYESFVNRKYDIVCYKTGVKEVTRLQEDSENFDSYHMDLAKCLIKVKSSVKDSFKKFQDIVLSAGIVKSDGSNLGFIHTTFVEYFATRAFIHWINKWQNKRKSVRKNFQKQQYFCSKVLYELNYRVIRSFLNAKLLKEKIENVQLKERYYNKNILFVSAMENLVGIAEFVFNNFSNVNINECDCNENTVLNIAATFGSGDMIKWLVEKGADMNMKDTTGRSVLHLIVRYGNLETIKWLADRGANINDKDAKGRSVLHEAAFFGRSEIVEWMVNNGAHINCKDQNSVNILHEAASSGNVQIFKYLVDKGANFQDLDKYGTTILHVATKYDSLEIMKFLVERGADINAEDQSGRTALHEAAVFGSLDTVKCLIDMNADINAEAKDGRKILYLAAASNNLEVVEYLMDHGADDKNMWGISALHVAAKYGRFETVQCLVKKGADVNAEDKNGRKILHEAAASGNTDIIKYLFDYGADINIEDNAGKKLMHEAASCGCLETVQWLAQKGGDINAEDRKGWKILHEAAAFGSVKIVKFLVDKGADINAKDKYGQSVLHIAAQKGHSDVVEWLVSNGAIVNLKDKYGRSVLHYAIAEIENLQIVEYLIGIGADINTRDINECSVLQYVLAMFGNPEVITWLVENGADINTKDKDDRTVLHYALIEFGNLETVKYLVKKGADINAKGKDGTTVLHYAAAKFGNLDIVKFLVHNGAEIDARDENGRTVLFYAVAEVENMETIKWLIDEGADITTKDNLGCTVLHHAGNGSKGNLEVIQLLIDIGVDIHARSNNNTTVMHYVVSNIDNLEVVKLLINNGADVNARDENDYTTLFYAVAEEENLETVKCLIYNGADIKAQDDNGCTILHHAVNGIGNLHEVKFLVDKGADVNATDNNNCTILHYAVTEPENIEIVKFLLEKGADVNAKDENNQSVLHRAFSESENIEIVKWLIEKGANVNVLKNYNCTVLHFADSESENN